MATIMENGKRITKKEMYERSLAHTNDDLEKQFIEGEIALLEKKNSAEKKPTKTQVENEGIKDTILEVLGEVAPATATMIATDPRVNVSNQKVTALLKQLIEVGTVVKVVDKGKSLFSLATVEE